MSSFNTGLTAGQLERIGLLVEELSEVHHILGKILRHGYSSYNPNDSEKTTNTSLLEHELGHLLYAIDLLDLSNDIDFMEVDDHREERSCQIKYIHFNQTNVNKLRKQQITRLSIKS